MKFKLSKLAAAVVAASAAGSAQAVTVNPQGTGQVLLLPYYNVNNNFVTNLEIVNPTADYKIVKVRLRESGNSQDVLDFNLYMTPHDVWKGVIRAVDRGGSRRANLISADTTCTLPSNTASLTINGVSGLTLKDTGWDVQVSRYQDVNDDDAREGYLEVIEMGVINPGMAFVDLDRNGTTETKLVEKIKHQNGVPSDCSVIEQAWTDGTGTTITGTPLVTNWGVPPGTSLDPNNPATLPMQASLIPPSGGLYAWVALLNTQTGASFIADATAIDHYSNSDSATGGKAQHYRPDDEDNFLLPSLASGDIATSLIVDASGDRALKVSMGTIGTTTNAWPQTVDATLNDGDRQTPRSGRNPLPIAHVLQQAAVLNSYFIAPAFDGKTEWVLTFPMKKHGIFNGKYSKGELTFDSTTGEFVCEPTTAGDTTQTDTSTTEGVNVCFKDSKKDVKVEVSIYDQEEATVRPDFTVSPPESMPAQTLAREVNVITFATTSGSSILGAPVVTNLNPGVNFPAGWARIDFAPLKCLKKADLDDNTTQTSFVVDTALPRTGPDAMTPPPMLNSCGIPVIGFAALQGRDFEVSSSDTFGETVEHRFERTVPTTP